jgi:hypothetical protein
MTELTMVGYATRLTIDLPDGPHDITHCIEVVVAKVGQGVGRGSSLTPPGSCQRSKLRSEHGLAQPRSEHGLSQPR